MKTLAIINEKGGVGKSFIATQFAFFCRFKLGNRVLVVDLDQQRNTSDILINSGLCVPTETTAGLIMKNGGLVKAEEPFMVIPGDDNLLELESMKDAAGITQNLYSALDAVSDKFDLCIIDCSPSADVRQLTALSLSTHYLIPFQVKAESISGVEKTLARAKVIQENVNNSLEFLGLLMSMVRLQGIQKKNFEWVIEQTQNLLLKKYEPKTGKFEGVCCIYERSEYTAAQQYYRPVFFSENGKPRREALELARVWVSIFKQLGLTPRKPIQIRKCEDSDKLAAVETQPVAEP